ncbi:hypothetical protein Spirs_3162 [Sediminispirochaeta smaragdinae DSM 11293]|jgi:hypothetical protein|uniref:Uncharacterized protein n=1 Tax=Sediminispirochaeta smaragdinae (strain DSM 11293 / JCM 15392 / SEBR 4228) TaxID=573413 RepID=E1R5D2_SEDSS|nr:hypothetical protein Spirs_3162 [Sediminispirochaeta smaragdinae DSM 11293]
MKTSNKIVMIALILGVVAVCVLALLFRFAVIVPGQLQMPRGW